MLQTRLSSALEFRRHNKIDTVIYSPGTYLVTLIVSDSSGFADTLQQYVVVPDCNSSRIADKEEGNSNFSVFPNPSSDLIEVEFDSSWSPTVKAELFGVDGSCAWSGTLSSTGRNSIPVSQMASGIYMLRLTDESKIKYTRVLVV